MTEELKTCPFCGGPAAFEEVGKGGVISWAVGCSNMDEDCIATQSITTFSRRCEAAEAWNKRHAAVPAQRSQTCPKCFRTDAEFKDTTEKRGIIPCGDPWHADDHLRRKIAVPAERGDGNRAIPFDRNALGRMVREAWVRWALTQPNPKPSWLAPYDDLDERDKEADRQIGEAIARWTLIGDAASSQSPAASADRQTLSEQERHAVEHARFQADRATPGDPECCFDFELVKTLVQIVDRRSPAASDDEPYLPAMSMALNKEHLHEITREQLAKALDLIARLRSQPERVDLPADGSPPAWCCKGAAPAAACRCAVEEGELERLRAQVERSTAALSELAAMVRGECPSLLNEDSGGNARLALEIEAILAFPSTGCRDE